MAVFYNAEAFYKELDAHAIDAEVDGIPVRVFSGPVTERYRATGASQGYYTRVFDALKELGCITVMTMGRRAEPSVIVLHYPPDETEFVFLESEGLTGTPEDARLRLRLENLEKRIGGVNIVDTLYQLDKRLTKVEREVGKEHTNLHDNTTQTQNREESQ
jgi:hypothetical protein